MMAFNYSSSRFVIELAYNGLGYFAFAGKDEFDLDQAFPKYRDNFFWVSHTWYVDVLPRLFCRPGNVIRTVLGILLAPAAYEANRPVVSCQCSFSFSVLKPVFHDKCTNMI